MQDLGVLASMKNASSDLQLAYMYLTIYLCSTEL